jgi:hypothetical protein
MANLFRISTINGFLLALYFVPTWTSAALKIVIFPIRGLYDRANIGPAIFFTDYFHLFATGTIRFAWLLAVAKLLVVAFFIVFAALAMSGLLRRSTDGDEALGVALVLGGLLSFVSMIVASMVGETAAVHLHATDTLMLAGGLVLMLLDPPRTVASSEVIATAKGI